MIVGLGLYSFYVRQLLASLFLFSAIFFSFGLMVLTVFLSWSASKQVARWGRSASRNVVSVPAIAGRGGVLHHQGRNQKDIEIPEENLSRSALLEPGTRLDNCKPTLIRAMDSCSGLLVFRSRFIFRVLVQALQTDSVSGEKG